MPATEQFETKVGWFGYQSIWGRHTVFSMTGRFLDWVDGTGWDESGMPRLEKERQDHRNFRVSIWD